MAMSYELAGRLSGTGVAVSVVYPGHGYTPGNRALPVVAFPRLYRPIVPALRLLGPRLMSDLARSARSSIEPAVGREGITGTYVNAKGDRPQWPKSVLDADARAAVWALCEELSGLTVNRTAA